MNESIEFVPWSRETTIHPALLAVRKADAEDDHLGVVEAFALLGHLTDCGKAKSLSTGEVLAFRLVHGGHLELLIQMTEAFEKQRLTTDEDHDSTADAIAEAWVTPGIDIFDQGLPKNAGEPWVTGEAWNRWFTGANRRASCEILVKFAQSRFKLAMKRRGLSVVREAVASGAMPALTDVANSIRYDPAPFLIAQPVELSNGELATTLQLGGWHSVDHNKSEGFAAVVLIPELRDSQSTINAIASDVMHRTGIFTAFPLAEAGLHLGSGWFTVETPAAEQDRPYTPEPTEEYDEVIRGTLPSFVALEDEELLYSVDAALRIAHAVPLTKSLEGIDAEEANSFYVMEHIQGCIAHDILTRALVSLGGRVPDAVNEVSAAFQSVAADRVGAYIQGVKNTLAQISPLPGTASAVFWNRFVHEDPLSDEESENLLEVAKHVAMTAIARAHLFAQSGTLNVFTNHSGRSVEEIDVPMLQRLMSVCVVPSTYDVEPLEDFTEGRFRPNHALVRGWHARTSTYEERLYALVIGGSTRHSRDALDEITYRHGKGRTDPPFHEQPMKELKICMHPILY